MKQYGCRPQRLLCLGLWIPFLILILGRLYGVSQETTFNPINPNNPKSSSNSSSNNANDLAHTLFGDVLDTSSNDSSTVDADLKKLLEALEDDGSITEEEDSKGIVFKSRLQFNRGRGITEPKPVDMPFVQKNSHGLQIEPYRLQYEYIDTINPTCIVLHRSCTQTFTKTLRLMERYGFSVQMVIDNQGRIFQMMDSIFHRANASKGVDNYALHIELIGENEKDLQNQSEQKKSLVQLLQYLSQRFSIPINNYDVESRSGVFSHNQVKRRFGGVIENDPFDPGYHYMYEILESAGGTFYNERQWKNRFSGYWYFHSTEPNIKPVRGYRRSSSGSIIEGSSSTSVRKGRGITDAPKPALVGIFSTNSEGTISERGRLRYRHYDTIEVTGITLHFTANESYRETISVLEERGLRVQIVVAEDGTVFQAMDDLEERATGAVGFNEHCIQIEIVGKNEEDLLTNDNQKKAVIGLVKALVDKYKIPKNNCDVDSNIGIFSHGQAKKRWGHSAWLIGTEFDAGEYYMKEIIESVGGFYCPEFDPHHEPVDFSALIHQDFLSEPYILQLYSTYQQWIQQNKKPSWKDRDSGKWVFAPYSWVP